MRKIDTGQNVNSFLFFKPKIPYFVKCKSLIYKHFKEQKNGRDAH